MTEGAIFLIDPISSNLLTQRGYNEVLPTCYFVFLEGKANLTLGNPRRYQIFVAGMSRMK